MAGSKHYVVWVGRKPGVYATWAECQKQTHKFDGAKFKSFESKAAADAAYKAGWETNWGQGKAAAGTSGGSSAAYRSTARSAASKAAAPESLEIDYDSISVDVGTSGNPGPTEYKGVDTQTGEVVFACGPIRKGTNNLGEFLAIVHALRYLQQLGSNKTVYSDSVNAMKWVNQKAVASTLARDASTAEIWRLVDDAVLWLKTNRYENKVLKWQTKLWGEIKADYGRK
ncbi:ribonuclease H-related protein [Paenibacillus curdlanolyticus YK9]|uniref:Ribonuclease H n=1 Tax=Paenibacillus curdlanolyticus YK9 TaxID=717606 RepID=E0IAT3_9BACL|nr:ribonuclease H family protein [Paenibacillus curdlanolyticus]EFM10487.1 ribonuclease H-related protein [Paenibacillus curdlanolyticus YK9]